MKNNYFEPAKQQQFFDNQIHQYPREYLFHPPLHTQLELEHISSRLKKSSQSTIIDFGSGSGRVAISLLQQKLNVIAVDISNNSLHNLSQVAEELHLSGLKTSNDLPTTEKITAIVGADVLHHIDMDEFLPRFYDLLQPGGQIIFSEPGALNPIWYFYLPFIDWEVEKGMMTCTYWNLTSLLTKYRFKNISLTGIGILPRPFFNWSRKACILHDMIGNIPGIKYFAYRYIIQAYK